GNGTAYLSAGGKGLIAPEELARHEWLAVAEAGGEGEPRVFAAAPLSEREIEAWFEDLIGETEEVVWREALGRVEAKRVRRLGAITLQSRPVERPDPEKIKEALLRAIAQKGLDILPWDKRAQSLRLRAACVEAAMPGTLPRLDNKTLLKTLSSWLGPYLEGARSLEALKKLNFYEILCALLGYEGLKKLDALAPERLKVPGGSRVAVDYSDPTAPVLPVKLQEMFGQTDTPTICDGRVALTLHLLSPAGRPLAVTRDLRSFWQNAYPDVRKDMRGRYPKHPWPEDPLTAVPTGKTKKRLRA
ncbi:MAG: ATP-dependent helicase HrpB, partial [Epsilonproteobacteria bacterium]|nr:ATP-dependent helicase HrpB [Campylobacterota bacterium]